MKQEKASLLSTLPMIALAACDQSGDSIETRVSAALVRACPPADPADTTARDRCADALTAGEELRVSMSDPFYWGQQSKDSSIERAIDDSHVTDFNPFLWRRIYLSVFTFDGPGKVETHGKYRVLRMPVRFRNMLPAGDYAYPFWHSMNKWSAYEQTQEVFFYFDHGKMIGALRSAQFDASRSHVERMFDGNWTWNDGAEPRVTLFKTLFSASNPHLPELEQKYRDFAEGIRANACDTCHNPSNPSMMKHLEILIYPNQALSGRHDMVRILKANTMPPGIGISDENIRANLIVRAEAFAEVADRALQYEGESVP